MTNLREAARLFELEKFNKSDAEKAHLKVAEMLSRDCGSAPRENVIEAIKVRYGDSRYSQRWAQNTQRIIS